MPFAFREEVICTKVFASKYSQPVPSPFPGLGGFGGGPGIFCSEASCAICVLSREGRKARLIR